MSPREVVTFWLDMGASISLLSLVSRVMGCADEVRTSGQAATRGDAAVMITA